VARSERAAALSIPHTLTTLPNGLQVVVHEDRRMPIVAVNVWYHVGSRNEQPGRTGLAHLFEHLMFEGSEHHREGYFGPLQEAGGALNGSTSTDRTNYWELVPVGALDLALWMEADRMGWLLPALSQERLDNQLGVVLNERRQSYENRPYGLAPFTMMAAIYPPSHPYHWPTIGEPADLEAATLEDVRSFFKRYYHPANASLVIAGDVDTPDALRRVERFFAEIPAGDPVDRLTPPDVMPAGRRMVMEDRVELARLYLAWPSPPLFADDDAALDLAADLIGNGRTSRLYKRLIYDRRIAVELAAGQTSRQLGGTFQIIASAAPGRSLEELETAIHEEIAAFASEGPTPEEIERGRAQAETAFVYRIQPLGGFGGRADQLNAYLTYLGAPDSFQRDLARYIDVSADDLKAAVGRWLSRDRVTTLAVVPQGTASGALADAEFVEGGRA
jgi:zinc protease